MPPTVAAMTRLFAILALAAALGSSRATEATGNLRRAIDVDRELNNENRIVGGSVVGGSTSPYPWFVRGDGCAGVLVAKDVVLSAAHCSSKFRGSVYVGAMRDGSTSNGAERRTIVSDMVAHPNFNRSTMKFDYMLFKVAPSTKTPIKLNDRSAVPINNQKLTVIGFGSTSDGGPRSSSLRQATIEAIPHAECNARDKYDGVIYAPTMLCAGTDSGARDACYGDSGGPLFDANKVLVGIVSFGIGCADPKHPGVYSRVSGQIDWIERQICSLTDYPPSFCVAPGGSALAPLPAPVPAAVPAPTPSKPISTTPVKYYIDVKYDGFPEEFSGFLVDKANGVRKWNHARGVGSEEDRFKTVRWQLPNLVPGRSYTLALRDSNGDGICCDRGIGFIEVWANRDSQKTQILFEWGNFGASKDVTLTVPESLQ